MIHKKVIFKGKIYWMHSTVFGCNISPLDHYSEDGKLLANPFDDISFAILEGNNIKQFGNIIGTVADLKDAE